MKRVLVIGTSGCGKSTTAKLISEKLGLRYIATDHFYWQPDWVKRAADEVEHLVDIATAQKEWVLDGNFDNLRQIVWARADTIVWLDFPFMTVVWRIVSRNFKWAISGERIWSGSAMTFRQACLGIRHSIRSWRSKHLKYPKYLTEFPAAAIFRFTDQVSLNSWAENPLQNQRSDASLQAE